MGHIRINPMATYQLDQIQSIILNNPAKPVLEKARKQADKLMLHLHGVGMDKAIRHVDYFCNKDVYNVQKEYAISNKDLFARLLEQEDMVFTAKGGSTSYGLPDAQEKQLSALLDNVSYGLSLRKWIKTIAREAYRADPMGIIFIEAEQMKVDGYGESNQPKAYPTYKSSYNIYDYLSNGRTMEYVVFRLTAAECIAFAIADTTLANLKPSQLTDYYRFIDDEKDIIVKQVSEAVIIATNAPQNPLKNIWGKCPAFYCSDLMQFNDPCCFVSPLDLTVELADCFLYDRSVRDLQKKYHGFAKAVEPLLKCATCEGNGVVGATSCPDCTPAGAQKGSGYKLRTKVSDVAKFPLEILENANFDYNKIFGYVSPDIDGWEKQDSSLTDLENLMHQTLWGTSNNTQQQQQKSMGEQKTATEIDVNNAPKEAKLNMRADWAERTESLIADFIGSFWFEGFKASAISYGRNYILETAQKLMEHYQNLRVKGAPDFSMDEALEKYYHAVYQNNPKLLTIYTKLLKVEPFPHLAITGAQGIITDFTDYSQKLYFGEWYNTLTSDQIFVMQVPELKQLLKTYVMAKGLKEPQPEPVKTASFN